MPDVWWYALLIVVFSTILMLADACIGYKKSGEMGEAGKCEAKGISGFRRAIIALTVILILGIAIFHLLDNYEDAASRAVVNNLLSMLAGLVAAIAGFYFGGRFTEKRTDEIERRAKEAEERARKAEEELKRIKGE
jgi:cobalamin synthase